VTTTLIPASLLPASRRVRLVLAGLAAAVVLALVYAAGVVSAGAFDPGENSPEAGFARDMSLHHEQAVEMGMLAYAKAADPDVRHEGYDIALTQSGQIGTMKAWLDKWHDSRSGGEEPMAWMPKMSNGRGMLLPDGRMPGMASSAELTKLNTVTGRDFDILFCQLMIRHHLGGIDMIEGVLAVSHNPDVVTLARSMKDNQQNEIVLLDSLLAQMGVKQ
jgi:uncharacterized protein (DUF305 family)